MHPVCMQMVAARVVACAVASFSLLPSVVVSYFWLVLLICCNFVALLHPMLRRQGVRMVHQRVR